MGGGYVNMDYSQKKQSSQSIYFVVIANFAILSYTARITARKVRVRLAGSWSWKYGMSNFIHGMEPVWNEMEPVWNEMEPVWDELAEMALFHGNPRQNNPVDEMFPFPTACAYARRA